MVIVCCFFPSAILRDWSTMISLLLRESDELITSALRSVQSAILLRLFAASAAELHRWYLQSSFITGGSSGGSSGSGRVTTKKRSNVSGSKGSSGGDSDDDAVKFAAWTSLVENIQRDLPRLLTRFRDDDANLVVMTTLVSCYDVSGRSSSSSAAFSSAATSSALVSSSKSFQQCLSAVVNIMDSSSNEAALRQLTVSMKSWIVCSGTSTRITAGVVTPTVTAVKTMLSGVWTKINTLIDGIQETISEEPKTDSVKATKKKNASRRKSNVVADKEVSSPFISCQNIIVVDFFFFRKI